MACVTRFDTDGFQNSSQLVAEGVGRDVFFAKRDGDDNGDRPVDAPSVACDTLASLIMSYYWPRLLTLGLIWFLRVSERGRHGMKKIEKCANTIRAGGLTLFKKRSNELLNGRLRQE